MNNQKKEKKKAKEKENIEKPKRRKHWIIKTFLVLLIIGASGTLALFGINAYVKMSVKDSIITADEAADLDADCILILGAGLYDSDTPSLMLSDRLNKGIELYELNASDKLLMTGDHGRVSYDEVNVMKQTAINAGIPSSDIFMDHAGFSTYESMYRARDVFEAKKVIIVTQGYHMYRALYIAEKLGLEAYGVATDPRSYGQAADTRNNVREPLARIKDFFSVLFKPEPTYLGDAIPVEGNGDSTNDKEFTTTVSGNNIALTE